MKERESGLLDGSTIIHGIRQELANNSLVRLMCESQVRAPYIS